jgi:hypothetical protein
MRPGVMVMGMLLPNLCWIADMAHPSSAGMVMITA